MKLQGSRLVPDKREAGRIDLLHASLKSQCIVDFLELKSVNLRSRIKCIISSFQIEGSEIIFG
jgi:hypothetical protein